MPLRGMISLTVSHVGGILIVIISPPPSLSFMDPSAVVGRVWPYFTTYWKHVLIGWKPTVASAEGEEGAGVEKEFPWWVGDVLLIASVQGKCILTSTS